jgi:hypothetical protein
MPVDEMLSFVVSIELQFYPQIGRLYDHPIRAWAEKCRVELGPNEEEDEEFEA